MSDNGGNRAAEGGESGQGFKGKKSNIGNLVNPPKKKLVKTMVVEYIAKSISAAIEKFKKKKKINVDDHHHAGIDTQVVFSFNFDVV